MIFSCLFQNSIPSMHSFLHYQWFIIFNLWSHQLCKKLWLALSGENTKKYNIVGHRCNSWHGLLQQNRECEYHLRLYITWSSYGAFIPLHNSEINVVWRLLEVKHIMFGAFLQCKWCIYEMWRIATPIRVILVRHLKLFPLFLYTSWFWSLFPLVMTLIWIKNIGQPPRFFFSLSQGIAYLRFTHTSLNYFVLETF